MTEILEQGTIEVVNSVELVEQSMTMDVGAIIAYRLERNNVGISYYRLSTVDGIEIGLCTPRQFLEMTGEMPVD